MRVYGPVQDGAFFHLWQVIGPRGGIKAEFYTKVAALKWIRRCKRSKKEAGK